jgi:hypothetical protein
MSSHSHPKSNKTIAPWQTQMGAFLMYPAQPAVLPAVAILVLCAVVAGYIPFIGWIIYIAVTISAYIFAFEILQHHADGWDEPPESMLRVSNWLVFFYLVSLFIAGILIAIADVFLGHVASIALLALFSFIQPVFTMVVGIEGSLIAALNPIKWSGLIRIFGTAYYVLAALLFVGLLIQYWLAPEIVSFLPAFVANAVAEIISIWIIFSSFYWMGYLIYQHHLALGFEPSALENQPVRPVDRDELLIKTIDTAITERTFDACIQSIKEQQRERVLGIAVHTKYRELLMKKGNAAEIHEHAQTFLHQLLVEKNLPRAMSLSIQQLNIDPDFYPLDAETSEPLLDQARRTGQSGVEKKLLKNLIKHFYKEHSLQKWTIRVAELLKQDGESTDNIANLLDSALAATQSEQERERIMAAKKALS